MAVTAQLVPDRITVLPNVMTTLTLRLYSDDDTTRQLTFSATGDLGTHARLESAATTIDTNQIIDVPMTLFVPSSVEAGTYTIAAEVHVAVSPPPDDPTMSMSSSDTAIGAADGSSRSAVAVDARHPDHVVIATSTVEVTPHSDYTIALLPMRSRGSSVGRHAVRVVNTGNVMIEIAVSAELADDDVSIDPVQSTLAVPAGMTRDTALRITPATRYWSGPVRDHDFVLRATSVEGRADELVGTYQQRPRVPNWLGPAAAGALAALVLGAIIWFAVLRPWVEDTADQAAAEAIEDDRAALRDRIAELEAAAAEAQQLPLGEPTDIRLDVAPTAGNVESASASTDPGTVLSVTDVVFQNPTGAVGTVTLRRGDDVVLQSELANFRDFDLHFVAPYVFDDTDEIVFEVECRTPGVDASTCPVGVSLAGFVDQAD